MIVMDTMQTDGAAADRGLPHVSTSYAASASSPGRRYKVEINLDTGLAQCECDGYRYRGTCRHIDESRASVLRVNYSIRLAAALSGVGVKARITGKIVLL